MGWKDVGQAIVSFLTTTLKDASLWFWLAVSAATLLVADKYGALSLANTGDPRTIVSIVFVVVISLWLNALELPGRIARLLRASQPYVSSQVRKIQLWAGGRRPSLRVLRSLGKVLATHCHERTCLLWMIAANPHQYLFRSAASAENEFRGMLVLLDLGIVQSVRKGNHTVLIVPAGIRRAISELTTSNSSLAAEVEAERQRIREQGRAALSNDLPSFLTEMSFE